MKHFLFTSIAPQIMIVASFVVGQSINGAATNSAPPMTVIPDAIQMKYLFMAIDLQQHCSVQGASCQEARARAIPKVKALFKELKKAGCDAGPVETRQIFEPLECK